MNRMHEVPWPKSFEDDETIERTETEEEVCPETLRMISGGQADFSPSELGGE
jgi:hypothetical protein